MEMLKNIVKALDEKHADDIVVLDMRSHSPIYDYMVITTAKNDRLSAGIIREIKDVAQKNDYDLKRIEGVGQSEWVLADLGVVVVHMFTEEARMEYNLEKLWRDIPRVAIEEMLA